MSETGTGMAKEDTNGDPIGSGDCDAETKITIGAPGEYSLAVLVCCLDAGHESLHLDDADNVWWRQAEVPQ